MSSSEVATPSPRGGALAKLRRNKASTTSLPASSGGDSDDAALKPVQSDDGRLRASMESAIGKVKERSRRRSVDERSVNDESRVANLLSRAKRRVKRGEQVDDLERNRSIESSNRLPGNRSQTSLFDESGRSSLLTEDERLDPDGKPIRPSLSPHDSHAGYLTLSSPEINSQTNPIIAGAEPDVAFPAGSLSNIPQIIEPPTSIDETADTIPPAPTLERSAPPANTIRGTFPSAQKTSGSRDPVQPAGNGGSGGTLGGLFKSSSRRSSVSSQIQNEKQLSEETVTGGAPRETAEVAPAIASRRPQTPKTRPRQPIDVSTPATPPNLVDTPTTLVTPPTPTEGIANTATFSRPYFASPRSIHSPDSIKHRRAQSANIPSKLSTSLYSPLTPTVEETKTPGGTLTQPATATGFFSTVFSAAQKAGVQFSNSINTTILPNQKSKPTSVTLIDPVGGEEVIPGIESRPTTGAAEGEPRELAVETLGSGNLSFSHLGISEIENTSQMNSTTELEQSSTQASLRNGESSRKAEQEAAARAVSSAYEKPLASVSQAPGRPMSVSSNDRLPLSGDQTPPRTAADLDNGGIKRSGSVRSKLSGRRKHRGSSATIATSNSIAAALKDTTAGLANPSMHGAGHRLTGFAVASSKRNKDFHQLFRSVPEDDYLIEDYSAALQRDILLHGRLYVSEGHICFSSNILGWVTNLVISFDEVVSVEKKSTAVIFPNAIVISTLHARNTFASFVARDSTYELLIGIWKISHPNLKSSLNGVMLDDAGTGDKTEVANTEAGSDEETTEGTEDEVYDEDADDDVGSFTDGGMLASNAGSEAGDMTVSRKASTNPVSATQPNGSASQGLEGADAVVTGAAVSSEFPGTPTHEPTQCSDGTEHYDRPLTDSTIPAPLGKVYSMMFGPASGAFMRKWLVEDEKSRELNYVDDKTGLDNDHTTFTFDYIKPLAGPVGPKQTKCITTNTLKAFDLEKAVSVDCSTSTPDVPSGNVFTVKTRYCLMWGPGNSTRMIVNCTVEWTGKSWLKGPIEKGAESGQIEYVNHIVTALKAAVTTKPPVKGMPRKGKRKGRKEVFDAEEANTQREAVVAAEQKKSAWGPLEPLVQIAEPIVAILRPLITSQVVITVLLVVLAYTWFASPRAGSGVGFPGYTSPERIAAYEEIWRREESALWDWLEDRVGVDAVYAPPVNSQRHERQKVLQAKKMSTKLDDEHMSDRKMDEQIRSTEEKLTALKEAVERRKARRKTS